MILKSIELKGFKSFPNKTLLTFPDGIISIIGPNGSGKSNVLDAVRWVLGEKSAKNLRGEKMEDVIFSGTKIHKSMNFCEVEIVFGNEDRFLDIDFTEVAIKRKSYRNGESKFYINGTVCRQKDIKELLLDSGIGKEGYSIISQGRIDEIVNSNPAQRRRIFEEASKISKNRYTREESQKKLENVKENLERINDIFYEIEKQVKPLKVQKENAQKYLELREELIKSDVNRILSELSEITTEIGSLKIILDEKNEKIATIDLALEDYIEQMQIEDVTLQNLELLTYKNNEEKNEMLLAMGNLKSKLEVSKSIIKNSEEQIEKNLEARELSKQKVSVAEKTYEDKEEFVLNLENKLKEYENEIENMQEKLIQSEDILKNSEALVGETNRKINEISNKKNLLENKKTLIEDSDSKEFEKITSLKISQENQIKIIGEIKRTLEEKTEKNNVFNEGLKKSKLELDQIVKNQEKISLAVEEAGSKIISITSSIKETEAKKVLFEDMEKHYEGMSNSVKFVLKGDKAAGVIDAVGNLISVDEEYERAIEAALGGSIQNIVTKTSDDAKKAIERLKKNKQGRATFLPLDTVKGSKLDLKNEVIASDLVMTDPIYGDIITQLLGRTIVVDTMEQGIITAKKYNQKYRIVTKGGEIFNTGGGITGGAFVKVANILSRKREIEELNLNIKTLEKEKDSLIKTKENYLESLKILIKDKGIVEDSIESQLNQISELKISINAETNKLEYEDTILCNINNNQEEYRRSKLLSQEELNNIVREIENQNIAFDETLKILEEGIKFKESNQMEVSRQRDEYNKKREMYSSIKGECNSAEAMIEQSKQILKQFTEQVALSEAGYQELINKVKSAEIEKDNVSKEILLKEESYKAFCDEDENTKELYLLQKKKVEEVKGHESSLQKERYILVEEKYQIENRYGKYENIFNNGNAKMEDDYQLTFEEAQKLKSSDVNQSKSHISKLKSQINSLGNINLDAIEEYETVNERYTLFLTQKTDLELSLDELEKINNDIEKVMKSEFKREFKKINELFKVTFKELFGGGEGELILSDEDDVLNCEIEIHAQPPGKKLKGISVMSGGEKALTAIAILFAILMTRPTPFCFLDEIDAPLDDVNIYRYNRYIKGLANQTQFITITHRRGTMEESDYIYGVTMEDKGISKVVSLKLEDTEKYVDN